ncbi:MAG TPA: adenylate/guanylate cyclase domain-containing protein, partial [Acidimicrobiia bacterium]
GLVVRRLLGRDTGGPAPEPSAAASPEQQQAWLFVAVARLTLRLAQRRPLVIAVDDLHWADRPSLDLLGHIAIELADLAVRDVAPVLVVATHRPDPGPSVGAELDRLRREEICSSLELGGLSEPAVSELVRTLGLEHASRQLVTAVQRTTRGNPLFVESIAARFARSGAAEARGGDLVTDSRVAAVPAELGNAISERVSEVSEPTRELLTLASFMGDTVRLGDLHALTGTPDAELHELLDEAVEHGVLAWEGADLSFAHPLYVAALRTEPAPSECRRMHLAISDALERGPAAADPARPRVIEVAHHLIEAGALAPPQRLLDRGREAGEQAWAMLAWGEAARCFAAAAAAAEQLDAPTAVIGELHYRAGLAHFRNLDRGPTRHHLERAAAAYRFAEDRRGVALALAELVRVDITTGSFGATTDLRPLDTALGYLDDTEAGLAARLLAQMAEALWVAGRGREAGERAERALELGRAAADRTACARALVALSMIRWSRLELHDALANLEEALLFARAEGDAWLEGIPLPRLAFTHLWLGHLDDATKAAQAAVETTDVTGDGAERSLALAALVGIAVARGDFDAAESRAEEAWAASRLARYEWSCLMFLPALVTARLHRDHLVQADAAVDRLRELQPSETTPYALVADVIGQLVRAYRSRGGAGADGSDEGLLAAHWPVALGTTAWFAVVAEVADRTGVEVPLAHLDDALDEAAGRGMVVTDGLSFLVPRVRGLVARLRGDDGAAEAQFRAALTVAEEHGLRPELARTYLELARLHRARSDEGEAGRLAARARDLFRGLGMPAFEEHARRLAAGEDEGDLDTGWHDGMAVILFTDVVDSTALTEEMGDAAYRARADTLDAAVREAIAAAGGETIEGIRLGDGVLAVFGSARSAVDCAQQIHHCARSHAFALHIGIHAGDVLRSRTGVHGGAVNIAARVCDRAPAGETLVSDTIRGLARTSAGVGFDDRGLHELKGVGEPMRLFAVVTPDRDPDA